MSLKFNLDKNEFDSLSNELKEHYVENDDGTFRLECNGESSEAIEGLRSALTKERSERRSFQDKVAQLNNAMQSVSGELQSLKARDAEMSLRSAVANAMPETVHPAAFDDILLLGKNELQSNQSDDGSVSFTTDDGKSVSEWIDNLLTKKPHWLKPSEAGGVSGGGGRRVRPQDGSAQQLIAEALGKR